MGFFYFVFKVLHLIKAIASNAPTEGEIEAIRKDRKEYANGEFYRYATIDELIAGFKKSERNDYE